MKTSITSKAFCSINDRLTDKIFTEKMLIYEGNLHKTNWSDIKIRGRENHVSPIPDLHTYRQTDRHTLALLELLLRS